MCLVKHSNVIYLGYTVYQINDQTGFILFVLKKDHTVNATYYPADIARL